MNNDRRKQKDPVILVVDDDMAMRMLMRESLEQGGMRVEEAENGVEALSAFERFDPDVVLMDVNMPEMDGFTACSKIRKMPGGEDATVVMVTGLDDVESIKLAYEVGATDFITKPINWPILNHRVRYLIRATAAFRALHRSKIRLSKAQRIARFGDWEWDIVANKIYFSEVICLIFGLEPQVFAATFDTFLSMAHPEDREYVRNTIDKALYKNEPYNIEHRIILPDGTLRTIHGEAEVVFGEGGKPISMHGTAQDITERKKTEQELLKSKKLESIGILAGGIAHDFNNILTGLFGNIELAKFKISKDHAAYTYIETANQALERATHLTKQLLTFAKGGAPILDAVDLKSVVQTTVTFNLSGSNVKTYFNLPDNLWQVKADKGQISQVIANLTINAKQAMPEGGNLYIDAEPIKDLNKTFGRHLSGNFVKLSIRDEGVGISPQYVERIFDPYFSTKQTGNGLGLATVYSIIAKHNGHISVDSIPDVGTTFTIFLPTEQSFHKQTATTHPALTERPKSASGYILVMDDERIIRDLSVEMLEACGYSASFSSDGKDAIEKYTSADKNGNPFDIIIMDLTVPGGIGGQEAVKKLLAIDPKAKAIVSSGYSTDPVMADYKDYGFKGRLVKPFQMDDLKKELSRVMEME